MNPPKEISKKDIVRVALSRMGDAQETWDQLKELGIVEPPQRKVTFTVTTEVRSGDTPETWSTGNLGSVMYRGSRSTTIEKVEDENQNPDPNEGTVSVEEFLAFALKVKKNNRYCSKFWNVVERDLGVSRPKTKPVTVSFTLVTSDFDDAEVDLTQPSDLDLSTLRHMLGELDSVYDYKVEFANK